MYSYLMQIISTQLMVSNRSYPIQIIFKRIFLKNQTVIELLLVRSEENL